MNKDKVIKDLKRRNDELFSQFRDRDFKYVLEEKRNHELKKQLEENEKRFNKAISLIEKHTTCFGDLILHEQLVKMLIDILDGEKNGGHNKVCK